MKHRYLPDEHLRFHEAMATAYARREAEFRQAYNDPTAHPKHIRRLQMQTQCA